MTENTTNTEQISEDHEFTFNIGLPNGIILSIIGLLVLATPLVHPMVRSDVIIDISAGVLLISAGVFSLYKGLKKMKNK